MPAFPLAYCHCWPPPTHTHRTLRHTLHIHTQGPRAQAHELEELTQIYVGRGLDYDLARKVAEQLTAKDVIRVRGRVGLVCLQGWRAVGSWWRVCGGGGVWGGAHQFVGGEPKPEVCFELCVAKACACEFGGIGWAATPSPAGALHRGHVGSAGTPWLCCCGAWVGGGPSKRRWGSEW